MVTDLVWRNSKIGFYVSVKKEYLDVHNIGTWELILMNVCPCQRILIAFKKNILTRFFNLVRLENIWILKHVLWFINKPSFPWLSM